MEHEDLIDAQFGRAVEIVQSLPKNGPIQTAYEDKLEMYSLFKQATVGDVEASRPAMWDVLGRAKWDAWEKQRGLDQNQAKWLYVQTLQKVLRRYSDRTIARDLVIELDSYGTDPSNLVLSGTLVQHSDDDSSSSSSVRPGRVGSVNRPTSLLQLPTTASPQQDPDMTVMSQTYHDAESEEPYHEDEEEEGQYEEEQQDVVQPVMSPPAGAASFRPPSAMSSQMRYRTPTANPSVLPSTSTPITGSVSGQQIQPLPRYATPSAFGQQPVAYPAAPSAPPSHISSSYPQYPTATGSTVGYYPSAAGRASSVPQPIPFQKTPLERAIEGMQASLAALHERMDNMEASSFTRTPPLASGYVVRGGGSPIRVSSPTGRVGARFDPRQTGAWSIILVPLGRVYARFQQILMFVAYPPHPGSTTARLIVLRRLLLDATFIVTVLGLLRSLWRATGIRRREVLRALVGVWHAIAGRQTKVLVDKGV